MVSLGKITGILRMLEQLRATVHETCAYLGLTAATWLTLQGELYFPCLVSSCEETGSLHSKRAAAFFTDGLATGKEAVLPDKGFKSLTTMAESVCLCIKLHPVLLAGKEGISP